MKKNQVDGIEVFGISRVASDFGMSKEFKDLLLVESTYKEIENLLNRPFRSEHYSLMFMLKGKIDIRVNMFEYSLVPNDFLIISSAAIKEFTKIVPGSILSSILFTKEYVSKLSLDQSYLDALRLFVTSTHYYYKMDNDNSREIEQLLSILRKRFFHGEKNSSVPVLLVLAIFNIVSELLLSQESLESLETKSRRANLVIRFFRLLPKHIRTNRDVKFYAEKLIINPKYLSNTLRELTGKSASSLIAEMAIMEARVLLSNSSLTIGQISHEMGFSDQFIFSKYFKHRTGLTPSEYRRRN